LHSVPRAISFNLVGHLTYLENFRLLTFRDPWWPWVTSSVLESTLIRFLMENCLYGPIFMTFGRF